MEQQREAELKAASSYFWQLSRDSVDLHCLPAEDAIHFTRLKHLFEEYNTTKEGISYAATITGLPNRLGSIESARRSCAELLQCYAERNDPFALRESATIIGYDPLELASRFIDATLISEKPQATTSSTEN